MASFNSIHELTKYIQNRINDVLIKEVSNKVKEIELKHISEDVIQTYTPKEYERRDTGGIEDPQNILSKIVTSGVLEIENITPFSPDPESNNLGTGLVGLIEYGNGWNGYYYEHGKTDALYKKPRAFIRKTKEDLKSNGQHIDALCKGLRRYNIIVK